MDPASIVERMAALPKLADVPREELEWLAEHGEYEAYDVGAVLATKGVPIQYLWIILSGHMAVRVDRGAGPRRVMEWHAGELSGMLPYSRMSGPPGDNYIEEPIELLTIHVDHFPEMISRCPTVTQKAVHYMLDRARNFRTSDLQDEKMVSLGKLAAGLAHELNNPAAATVRGAKVLMTGLAEADAAARAFGAAQLTEDQLAQIEALCSACVAKPTGGILSPLEQADREDEIVHWLDEHGADPDRASILANTPVTLEELDQLAALVPEDVLDVVLRWTASRCFTSALALDIERAANRISELVGSVKRFTYMDSLAGPESVDVEAGLRDTLRVMASKAKDKGAAVSLDMDADLPRVLANGGELNQIWLNLIDNALDSISESGKIEISGRKELGQVVVRIVDDGPGIPPDILPQIFDPFFTTKAPGEGTGLGLEVARRLVRSYRGELTVESEPGRTEFRVRLPAEVGRVQAAG